MCHHGPGPGPPLPGSVPPPPPPQTSLSSGHIGSMIGIGGGGIGPPPPSMGTHCGGSGISGMIGPPPPPPPLCNPCSSNSFNSVPIPGPSSRWGPRTSCPIHSPFRVRVPNGSICSGHQVSIRTKTQHTSKYLIHTLYSVCT